MISYLDAIILGIIQGITEWFPISSSGHLVLAQELLKLEVPVVFDVALHVGSLLALLILFRKDIIELIQGLFKKEKESIKLAWFLILGTIPAALAGILLKDFFESTFTSVWILALGFFINAIILFVSKYHNGSKDLSHTSVILIGVAQAFSIFSSVSRSAMTVSSGLFAGVRKEKVARFAFLLAIPALFGAAVLEIPSLGLIQNIPVMLVGVFISFIVGYISLRWLVKLIASGKFHVFWWYNILVGLVVLLFLL